MRLVRLVSKIVFCLWSTFALSACAGRVSPSGEMLTLYVAPERRECVGVTVQQCLLVKQGPDAEWELFYDAIHGFAYEPGFHYTLRVERRRVADPPQDASAFEWQLIEVLEKRPA